MKSLFVADPVEALKASSDSSLALLRACPHDAYWTTAENVVWSDGEVRCLSSKVQSAGGLEELPELASPQPQDLRSFDFVLIRREPPFDPEYLRTLWWLWKYEKYQVQFNSASSLLAYHEKIIPYLMKIEGVLDDSEIFPTGVCQTRAQFENYLADKDWKELILKPLLGYGGRDIHKFEREEFLDRLSEFDLKDSWLVQEFETKIYDTGDRRALYVDGELQSHFVRIPREGDFVSNLSQGGSVIHRDLSPQEEKISQKLGEWLKREGIAFAGADFMADRLSEVNITCPTGLVQAEEADHKDLSQLIWKMLQSKR